MNRLQIRCITTVPALLLGLTLACLSSLTAQGADKESGQSRGTQGSAIVGLWHVQYHGDLEGLESFDQWYSDGLEFEVANEAPGVVCQGTWEQVGRFGVQLFHTGWNYDSNGQLTGYFNETQTITVSLDGQTYDGTYDLKDYDTTGHQLDELTGTLHATRLSVNPPR